MIPVALAPEPTSFDIRVRQSGLSAIDELVGRQPRQNHPGAKYKKIAEQEEDIPADKFPPYWRRALSDMLTAYERRCAYLATYIHHATGSPTVDHVLPKSQDWKKIYEWDNYCLCAAVINSKKGALLTLVDPFTMGHGWFELNINNFHVRRAIAAPQSEWSRIDATLPVLNLRLCIQEREEYVYRYRLGPGSKGIDLTYLEHRAPFIASELRRQGKLVRGDV